MEKTSKKIENIHGIEHTERVYTLVCCIANIEEIDNEGTEILMRSALYHDIGRTSDGIEDEHGKQSFIKIMQENLIDKRYKHLETVRFIIENHCIDDGKGINNIINYNIKDKEKAVYLYKVFKDADNLDRVRINDLDTSFLRLESSHKLVGMAYGLLDKKHINDKCISLIRVCQARTPKDFLKEVENHKSKNGLRPIKYNGLCAGVYGEKLNLNGIYENSEKLFLNEGVKLVGDFSNYKNTLYLKAKFLYGGVKHINAENPINYYMWRFKVDINNIIGYCFINVKNGEAATDGVILKNKSSIDDLVKLSIVTIYTDIENQLDQLDKCLNELNEIYNSEYTNSEEKQTCSVWILNIENAIYYLVGEKQF